ncbi:MAG: DUF1559 domain-containing protein [Pirellulaceae bacterium]|nr:DUF1559 domain-containing protein [Planctomycetales bacterium]
MVRKIPTRRDGLRYPCACGQQRAAMTLVELLVVLAVIVSLMALLLPAIQAAREASRRTACLNNLRQLGIAMTNYESQHIRFPVGCVECLAVPPPGALPRLTSWNVELLPSLEQASLWEQFDRKQPIYMAENRDVVGHIIDIFICPSSPRPPYTSEDINGNGRWDPGDDMAYTDYGGIYGVEGPGRDAPPGASQLLDNASLGVILYDEATTAQQIRDGLSQTVLVGECAGRTYREQSEWANGHNVFAQHQSMGINQAAGNELRSQHPGLAGVVYCDAHAVHMSQGIDQSVLIGLLTRDGRELVKHE